MQYLRWWVSSREKYDSHRPDPYRPETELHKPAFPGERIFRIDSWSRVKSDPGVYKTSES
jgi:hypothetical protein